MAEDHGGGRAENLGGGKGEDQILTSGWEEQEKLHEQELLEHWSLKRLWCDELREIAVGAEEGRERGEWLHWLETSVRLKEAALGAQHQELENALWAKLAAVNEPYATTGTFSRPSTVLQTYTYLFNRYAVNWKNGRSHCLMSMSPSPPTLELSDPPRSKP